MNALSKLLRAAINRAFLQSPVLPRLYHRASHTLYLPSAGRQYIVAVRTKHNVRFSYLLFYRYTKAVPC